MNFAKNVARQVRGVRWNPDTECFEMRCFDCARKRQSERFWPLTLEFWTPDTMQRCRACEADRNRRARVNYYWMNRSKELARQKAYDAEYRRPHRKLVA